MTREEGFHLITRALVLCCLVWFGANLVFLPNDVMGVAHHAQGLRLVNETTRLAAEETYFVRYYAGLASARVIIMVADLWLALWLYRGAAGARKFFLLEAKSPLE